MGTLAELNVPAVSDVLDEHQSNAQWPNRVGGKGIKRFYSGAYWAVEKVEKWNGNTDDDVRAGRWTQLLRNARGMAETAKWKAIQSRKNRAFWLGVGAMANALENAITETFAREEAEALDQIIAELEE